MYNPIYLYKKKKSLFSRQLMALNADSFIQLLEKKSFLLLHLWTGGDETVQSSPTSLETLGPATRVQL